MRSAEINPADIDTILPAEVAPAGPPSARSASLPRMIRDYFGFESIAGDEPRSGRSSSLPMSGWRSREGRDGMSGGVDRETALRPTTAADVETVWPGVRFAATPARSATRRPAPSPDPAPAPPAGDLRAAATVYLEARARTEGADRDATVLPAAAGPVLAELHRSSPERARRLAEGLVRLPAPGEVFCGFRLVEEIGRGAFGRVFLAQQGDLAGRPVALKVSAELPGESRTLARLQHTNIVPIFSAHESGSLHAVCMPYFGRATLADLLEGLEGQASLPASGREVAKVVASRRSGGRPSSSAAGAVASDPDLPVLAASSSPSSPVPAEGACSATLERIGRLSYVDAVLWMGARIADGLAHAHSRGVLHRDLKPANVLMTDDGQPMILDFNLSEDAGAAGDGSGASAASAGGTLRYMAPEHLERFLGGEAEVDARGDVFALGVMLYELLTGRPPYEVYAGHSVRVLRQMIADRRGAAAPGLRGLNPAVSPAAEAIVRRCLAADLAARYGSADEVREDIERHLADLPLRHACEPSLRERAGKWLRRHPRLRSSSTLGLVAGALLIASCGALVARGARLARFEAAAELASFQAGVNQLRGLAGHCAIDQADRASRAALQGLGQQLLGRYHVLDDPNWRQAAGVLALPAEDQAHLRDDVAEILMALAQAKALDAAERPQGPERAEVARSGERLNRLAMAGFGKGNEPQAFHVLQAALVGLIGREDEAARLAAEAHKLPLRTARDHYLAAAVLCNQGEFAKALPLAEEATRLDPAHFWSYFVLGVCHSRLGHDADAMACFTTCTALRPDFAESWLFRGIAQYRRVHRDQAIADFDRAAKLRPDWYEPPLNRAMAHRDAGDHRKAENDLTRALDLGAPAARAYFLRAAERRSAGDKRGAEADLAEGLRREPTDVPGWIARGNTRMGTDPEAALGDFAAALRLDPRSHDAIHYSAYILASLPGRQQDAIRMLDRGIEVAPDFAAFRAIRGVMHASLGHRDEAHRDAREALWRDTTPATLYQVAGVYATTSKAHPEDRLEAYRLLGTALRAGYGFDLIEIDRELDAIRDQPEFAALVDSARAQAKERLPNLHPR